MRRDAPMPVFATLAAAEVRPRSEYELGVIDLGSNTARLVIFEATPEGGLRPIFEVKEVPRMGKGVTDDGSLASDAMERGLATVRRFARHLAVMGDPPVAAVATSAIRDAPNGQSFIERVERKTGIAFRILSGEEEARLGYLGVASSWELDRDVIADLGGGSLQLAVIRQGRLEVGTSLPLGALRTTQEFFAHDPPKRREVEGLRAHVRAILRGSSVPFPPGKGRVLGVGGTIRCLARAAMELRDFPVRRVHGYRLRERDLEVLDEILFEMDAAQRRDVPGIGPARAELIVAGLVVVGELLRSLGSDSLLVSGYGIREGVAAERFGIRLPAPQETLTYRSVTAAARAFGFSLVHGAQVHRLALQLFDVLQPRFGWTPSDRLVVSVAAWMHDVGAVVDPWRHAQHSAYLIRNLSLLALTDREALMASLVAYLHEGDPIPEGWSKTWRPLLEPGDLELAGLLGTLVAFSETLEGTHLRLSVPRGSHRLVVEANAASGPGIPPRALERLRKPIRRAFGLDLVAADE